MVSYILSVGLLFGDEQIRQGQEELRKRHLFYGEISGQTSSQLTAAITHYQKRKGLALTGRLDPETSASLGLVKPATRPAQVPFVVVGAGTLRGPNGEALPDSRDFGRVSDVPAESNSPKTAVERVGNVGASAAQERRAANARSRSRSHRVQKPRETNPFVLAFNSLEGAIRGLVGDPPKKRAR